MFGIAIASGDMSYRFPLKIVRVVSFEVLDKPEFEV